MRVESGDVVFRQAQQFAKTVIVVFYQLRCGLPFVKLKVVDKLVKKAYSYIM